jgi:hypothetical protein
MTINRRSGVRRSPRAKNHSPSSCVARTPGAARKIVFDQGLGDIFVLRTAGNVVDNIGLGSIEYAVEHFGTQLVLVLGHSHCGAVAAAVSGGEAHCGRDPARCQESQRPTGRPRRERRVGQRAGDRQAAGRLSPHSLASDQGRQHRLAAHCSGRTAGTDPNYFALCREVLPPDPFKKLAVIASNTRPMAANSRSSACT